MRGFAGKSILFFFVLVYLSSHCVLAEDRISRLAVFDIQTGEIKLPRGTIQSLTEFLKRQLSKNSVYETVTKNDFLRAEDALWKYLHQEQARRPCDDPECHRKMAREAGADGWVVMKIDRTGWRCRVGALMGSVRLKVFTTAATAEGSCTIFGLGSSIAEVAKVLRVQGPKFWLPPLSNADVLGCMRQRIAEFKACNRKQKEIDPSVKGKMVITFVVRNNGSVREVRVTTPEFRYTFVAACMSKVIMSITFPESSGYPKTVPFPFTVK